MASPKQFRRVLYFSGNWSVSHVWMGTVWGLWSSSPCCCRRFTWDDAKVGDEPGSVPPKPPKGWPVSKRCLQLAAAGRVR